MNTLQFEKVKLIAEMLNNSELFEAQLQKQEEATLKIGELTRQRDELQDVVDYVERFTYQVLYKNINGVNVFAEWINTDSPKIKFNKQEILFDGNDRVIYHPPSLCLLTVMRNENHFLDTGPFASYIIYDSKETYCFSTFENTMLKIAELLDFKTRAKS